MVSVLASSVVDRDQIKPDYEIGISCFSAKHAALRGKITDWWARNPDSVSEWSDMSTLECCFNEIPLYKSN
jgi:hypothetical protein